VDDLGFLFFGAVLTQLVLVVRLGLTVFDYFGIRPGGGR
jgi:hypothetical protein